MNKAGRRAGVQSLQPLEGDFVVASEDSLVCLEEGDGGEAAEEDRDPHEAVDPDGGCGVPSVGSGQSTGEDRSHGSGVGGDPGDDVGHGGAGGRANDADMLRLLNERNGEAVHHDGGGGGHVMLGLGGETDQLCLLEDHGEAMVFGELLGEVEEGLEGGDAGAEEGDVVSLSDAGEGDVPHVEAEAGGVGDQELLVTNDLEDIGTSHAPLFDAYLVVYGAHDLLLELQVGEAGGEPVGEVQERLVRDGGEGEEGGEDVLYCIQIK